MKRSEMEMVILRALAELDVNYPDGYDYNTQAAHILNRIEDAGMLPPLTNITTFNSANSKIINLDLNMWNAENEESQKN